MHNSERRFSLGEKSYKLKNIDNKKIADVFGLLILDLMISVFVNIQKFRDKSVVDGTIEELVKRIIVELMTIRLKASRESVKHLSTFLDSHSFKKKVFMEKIKIITSNDWSAIDKLRNQYVGHFPDGVDDLEVHSGYAVQIKLFNSLDHIVSSLIDFKDTVYEKLGSERASEYRSLLNHLGVIQAYDFGVDLNVMFGSLNLDQRNALIIASCVEELK